MAVVDTDERAPQLPSALFLSYPLHLGVMSREFDKNVKKIKQMKTAPLQKSGSYHLFHVS